MSTRSSLKFRFGFLFTGCVLLCLVGSMILYFLLLTERFDISNIVVRISVLVFLVFLILLIVRYVFLLWFAFLNHLERGEADPPAHEPLVSVIVPAYNEELVIESAIRSLASLEYFRYEIVVVDDGSSDATYRRALTHAERHAGVAVRVVSQPNAGKAEALNRGVAAARGDYILCVDGDSVLAPGSLRAAIRHFRDPQVGAVAGNIKVANRVNLLTWLQAVEYVEGLNLVRSAQAFFRAVNIVPGPLGLFRRDAILSVGGFPSGTFAEDCDFTLALLGRGWRITYEPRAIAYTEAPEHLRALLRQRYRWTRGILQALRRHRGQLTARRALLSTRATILMMVFESVIWPAMNVVANVFLLAIAWRYGLTRLLVLWWLQLTLLDAVGALFCVAAEGEDFRLVPLSLVYRAGYILFIDLCKVLAMSEEMVGVSMTWGKLERVGRFS